MLTRGDEPFTSGVTAYSDHDPARQDREAKVYIRILVQTLDMEVYAMVDTGAPYCVLQPELARHAGLAIGQGERIKVNMRGGSVPGELLRGTITIPATVGDGLEVDATIFVPDHWDPALPNFLGYQGFLERIRFAISPVEKEFYFGLA